MRPYSTLRPPRRRAAAIALVAACAAVLAQQQSAAVAKDDIVKDDVVKDDIFARKIMMDTIDRHMDAIDWMLTSGKPIDLAAAGEDADTMSVMLQAFPHLFPPATNQWRADAKGERDPARDTFAAPELWANFADFYQRAAAAAKTAYAASRARSDGELRKAMAALRTACDSCHALYVKGDK
jgi:cytochrome c556